MIPAPFYFTITAPIVALGILPTTRANQEKKKKEGFYFTTFLLPPPAKHQPLVTDPFFLQGLPFRVRQRVNPNQKMGVMKQE